MGLIIIKTPVKPIMIAIHLFTLTSSPSINIESKRDLNGSVSVALRPEKINISKEKNSNSILAKVNNASFVGSNYQYIFNSTLGKLYVVSGDTNNIFKVNEEVCLTIDAEEIKILED